MHTSLVCQFYGCEQRPSAFETRHLTFESYPHMGSEMLAFPRWLNLMRVPQVAPSFFDAPGAQGSSGTALPSAPVPQLPEDQLPNITFAFASEVGYKVSCACSMHVALETVTQMHAGDALVVHWGCTGSALGMQREYAMAAQGTHWECVRTASQTHQECIGVYWEFTYDAFGPLSVQDVMRSPVGWFRALLWSE